MASGLKTGNKNGYRIDVIFINGFCIHCAAHINRDMG